MDWGFYGVIEVFRVFIVTCRSIVIVFYIYGICRSIYVVFGVFFRI